MLKRNHEFRDPVHDFIRLDADERRVVNSEPFQRLRHIHQLAMTYMVYPGATHRRFEHSLGCMELATRIFDTITRPRNLQRLPEEVEERLVDVRDEGKLAYWKRALRLAALCHDIGHLPFSHAGEELLPDGVSHETMTKRLIMEEMDRVWSELEEPCPKPEQIAKIAVGAKETMDLGTMTPWETILSEIITGDVFGADRMDYLLRDSLHAGVAYGHFDHHRLIDTLRILPGAPKDNTEQYNPEPELGIEQGGKQVAESLLMARYLMFTQVYFHPVRRIYDRHLERFLREHFVTGQYSVDLASFLGVTDSEVLVWAREAAKGEDRLGHEDARRIVRRDHFKKAYGAAAQDIVRNATILQDVGEGLKGELGNENVIIDSGEKKTASKSDFPIRMDDGRILSAHGESGIMTKLPAAGTGYVFVHPKLRNKACDWVKKNLQACLEKSEVA